MRILYLHQYFNTRRHAGSTRSYEIARRLVARGHEVNMVTSERSAAPGVSMLRRSQQTVEDGIRVHWLPVPYSNSMSYAQRIWAFSHFAVRSLAKVVAHDSDVIFATSTPLTIAMPAVAGAQFHRIPMVFEVRDLWPEVPILIGAIHGRAPVALAQWLERFAYRHAERIIALSPGMAEGIVRCGYPAQHVTVIPNFAHLDLFGSDASSPGPFQAGQAFRRRYNWLQDRPLVVYLGTLGRANGVGYLAQVAAAMRHRAPDARFLVVGTGYEEPAIRALAEDLGVLGRNFFMMEPVAKAEAPALLSAATVATSLFANNPALWTNSANKFFDALAAGRPIAINYGGWQADLIQETGCGLVMPADSPEKGAALLCDWLVDEARLRWAGKAAHELATTCFHPEAIVDQFERVLFEAVAADRTRI